MDKNPWIAFRVSLFLCRVCIPGFLKELENSVIVQNECNNCLLTLGNNYSHGHDEIMQVALDFKTEAEDPYDSDIYPIRHRLTNDSRRAIIKQLNKMKDQDSGIYVIDKKDIYHCEGLPIGTCDIDDDFPIDDDII